VELRRILVTMGESTQGSWYRLPRKKIRVTSLSYADCVVSMATQPLNWSRTTFFTWGFLFINIRASSAARSWVYSDHPQSVLQHTRSRKGTTRVVVEHQLYKWSAPRENQLIPWSALQDGGLVNIDVYYAIWYSHWIKIFAWFVVELTLIFYLKKVACLSMLELLIVNFQNSIQSCSVFCILNSMKDAPSEEVSLWWKPKISSLFWG
jgi:hypothetical protein